MRDIKFTRSDEFTEATRDVAAQCTVLVMTLPPEDRLNAVVAIARMWTDFREVQEN